MTYCFKCPRCGLTTTSQKRTVNATCVVNHEATAMRRDYRAESVGATGMVQLKRERNMGGRTAYRDTFLPTAKDYESKDDPDGQKGIRKWNDEHTPHSTASGAPLRPDVKRRSW